ncbi:Hypothetical_protein [Hexamita inflata]|uniref:Hypothetical_protein n=1 Tax=Hexamita inflata TaxID=28002 RepID=A0AA86PYQ4_9EUKA|nr:Hypothetical protein HINF_LOCUS35428 [Hexamita inflata]
MQNVLTGVVLQGDFVGGQKAAKLRIETIYTYWSITIYQRLSHISLIFKRNVSNIYGQEVHLMRSDAFRLNSTHTIICCITNVNTSYFHLNNSAKIVVFPDTHLSLLFHKVLGDLLFPRVFLSIFYLFSFYQFIKQIFLLATENQFPNSDDAKNGSFNACEFMQVKAAHFVGPTLINELLLQQTTMPRFCVDYQGQRVFYKSIAVVLVQDNDVFIISF